MKKRVSIIVMAGVVILATGAGLFKSDFFEIAKQIEIFTEAYKRINMNYVDEVDPADMMDTAIKSMFEDLDPYTNFWSAQEVQEGRLRNSGSYTGIGASIQSLRDEVVIKQVFKDAPADQAGLKPGDRLVKIDDNYIADLQENAGELLKGAPGTTIEITFERQGKQKTTTLKRKHSERKLVPFYDVVGDVGYIKLTEFGQTTSKEVGHALSVLKEKGAEKLILDLRNNPGGLLEEAVNTVNLFIPKGQQIVSTKSTIEKYNKTYMTRNEALDLTIPLVVLINAHSASASEIVSGSIQDLDRGVVIGARSFGKGLVQRVTPLSYGTQMKLTISRYYTPSGRGIQALDYWHKDENGNPLRTEAKDYNAFTTANGRTVYDGGGINPDIKLESSEISGITQALLDQNIILDFSTDYYNQHKLEDWKTFELTTADFKAFKQYLKNSNFTYEPTLESAFKEAFDQAEHPILKKEIEAAYNQLMTAIDQAKDKELEDSKPQIEQQLTAEILRQYFYEEGLYAYNLQYNPEIKKAMEILNSPGTYKAILQK